MGANKQMSFMEITNKRIVEIEGIVKHLEKNIDDLKEERSEIMANCKHTYVRDNMISLMEYFETCSQCGKSVLI